MNWVNQLNFFELIKDFDPSYKHLYPKEALIPEIQRLKMAMMFSQPHISHTLCRWLTSAGSASLL